jgi:RHS repeat-associated protein
MKFMNPGKRFAIGILSVAMVILLAHANSNNGPVSASDQQVQAIDLIGKQEQQKVDLFTGSFGYAVPIKCAPARNGSEPNLSLTYSSAGDNGWCGMGWTLTIGYIERNTRDGFPIQYSTGNPADPLNQYDDSKGFLLNLSGRDAKLFAVATNGAMIEYRAEVDTGFLRCFCDTNNNTWTIYDKSGTAYYFGEAAGSRVANSKTGWGSGYNSTFRWALDQIVTATGDLTTIAYTNYTSPYTSLSEKTLYPLQITYNGHTSNNTYSATSSGANTITFATELRPNDWHFSYRTGFRMESDRRLTNILCSAGSQKVWSYNLKYGTSPATDRSLLTNVVLYGFDANNNASAFLTNTFTYQANTNGATFGSAILWSNLDFNTPGYTSGSYEPEVAQVNQDYSGNNYTVADLVDMDGDGLPDRVCFDETGSLNRYRIQKNLGLQANGNGLFAQTNSFGPTSTGSGSASDSNLMPNGQNYGALNTPYGRIRDLNADGLPDRLMDYWKPFNSSPTTPYYTNFAVMLNNGSGFSSAALLPVTTLINYSDVNGAYLTYECVEGGGTVNYGSYSINVGVGLFDINGDGYLDREMTTFAPYEAMTNLYVQVNTGTNFTQLRRFPYKSQNSLGADYHTVSQFAGIETPDSHFMDLNGDGLPDHIMWPFDPNQAYGEHTHPVTYFALEYNDGYSFESTNSSTGSPGAFDKWPGVVNPVTSTIIYDSTTFYGDAIWDLPFVGLYDVNGDGLPDRLMMDPATWGNSNTGWLVYLNNGHGFDTTARKISGINNQGHVNLTADSPWWSIQGTGNQSPESGNEITTLIDINGDGLLDRVMAVYYSSFQNPTAHYFLVQLNQGPSPDLLTNINNGIGGNIGVSYKSSTAYDNRVDTSNPNSVSHMPYPRQVTASITESDGINSPQTTTYGYSGGFYDGSRREFHGFAVVTNTDPTLRYTVTYFHTGGGRNYSSLGEYQDTNSTTGAGNFAKAGMAYRVETYGNDNKIYNVLVSQVDQASLGNGRYFPFVTRSFDCDYPGNGTPKVTATDFAYDLSTGNLTNKVEYGLVTGFNPASVGSFSFTDPDNTDNRYFNTHYTAIGTYIVDHPDKVTLADVNNNVIRETDYSYNSGGTLATKLNRISDSYFATNSYANYNSYGLVGLTTDPVGVQTEITYDSTHTFPATSTVGGTFTTSTTYDPGSGQLAVSTDVSGLTTSNSFDVFNRLTEVDQIPIGGGSAVWVQKISYPTVLKPIASGVATNYVDVLINDGMGGEESRTYIDGFGRPIQTRTQAENGSFRVASTAYDGRGKPFLTTWSTFGSGAGYVKPATSGLTASWIGFDAAGRVATNRPVNVTFTSGGAFSSASANSGDGTQSPMAARTCSYVNGSNPWWVICTDEDGKVRKYQLDAFGRTNEIQEVDGSSTYTTTLNYDLADNLTNIVNANSENIYWVYNDMGGLVAMADPHLGQWTYQRDYANRLRVQTDARGNVIKVHYTDPTTGFQDPLGRVMWKEIYSSNYVTHALTLYSTVTNIYDSGDSGYAVYPGQLYEVIDKQGWEKTSYDTRERIIKTTRYLNINSNAYTTSYTVDDGGNVTSIAYPNSGPTITNVYWNGGSIHQVSLNGSSVDYYTAAATAFDEFDHVTNFVYGNSLTTTHSYYSNSKRLETISAGSVFTRTYEYTSGNDIKSLSGTGLTNATTVTYDNLHRIKSYTGLTSSYGYDAVGNITTNGEGGSSTYTYANPRKQAVRTAFGYTNLYDLCGNMVVRHGGLTNSQALTYDPENQLLAIAQAGVFSDEFGYAADGTRLWKRIDQNPTNVQVWIGNIYEEKSGKKLFHVFAGSQQVCTFEAGSPLDGGSDTNKVGCYYCEDSLNTSSALSDSAHNQIEVNVYYPFGRTQTASPQASFQVSRRFTGQVFDAESGLYYYNARYYDSELGRFIQPDDKIPDFSNPQSYNRYSYVLNNPLRYTDPSGHQGVPTPANFALGMTAPPGMEAEWNQRFQAANVQATAYEAGALAGTAASGGVLLVAPAAVTSTTVGGYVVAGAAGATGGYVGNGTANWVEGQPFNENAGVAAGIGAGLGLAGRGISDVLAPAPESKVGPYSHLEDHPSVGPGKNFTRAQKEKILNANAQQNAGELHSDQSGRKLSPAQQSKKGVTPPANEAHVDHIVPKSKGGSNSYKNAQVLSREENLKKSDN